MVYGLFLCPFSKFPTTEGNLFGNQSLSQKVTCCFLLRGPPSACFIIYFFPISHTHFSNHQSTNMHLNFWLYKSKLSLKGTAPLYLRVTINGDKAEIATGVIIPPNNWNSNKGIVKGNTNEAKALNQKLKQLKESILKVHNELVATGIPISPDIIKYRLLGTDDNQITLMYAFKYHHGLLIKQPDNPAMITKYNTLLSKVVGFLRYEYNREDLYLKELNHQFVVKFELYMKSEQGIGHNTTIKYIQFLKKIIHMSVAHGWIAQNPFANFKCSLLPVDRGYLSLAELNKIHNKNFEIARLEDVKNIFIFCCYTGLAYVDVKALERQHLVQKDDGSTWIIIHRRKTGIRSPIPLLQQAQKVLDKYNDGKVGQDNLLPVISNQKMNAYLKEIGEVCGIEKSLTFHLARHTFATTITLSNGVPIETVSKMLGHTNLKTTQVYAKVLDSKIAYDMEALKKKLE